METLYRYGHNREDLLEPVVARLLEGVRVDLDDRLARDPSQGYLQTLANSVRRIAVEHAAAFPSSRPGDGTSPVEVALDAGDAQVPHADGQLDLRAMPDVARLQPLLSEDRGTEEFETALETLLDRLELALSQ